MLTEAVSHDVTVDKLLAVPRYGIDSPRKSGCCGDDDLRVTEGCGNLSIAGRQSLCDTWTSQRHQTGIHGGDA